MFGASFEIMKGRPLPVHSTALLQLFFSQLLLSSEFRPLRHRRPPIGPHKESVYDCGRHGRLSHTRRGRWVCASVFGQEKLGNSKYSDVTSAGSKWAAGRMRTLPGSSLR